MIEQIYLFENKLVEEIKRHYSDTSYLERMEPVLDFLEQSKQWALLGNESKALRCFMISYVINQNRVK